MYVITNALLTKIKHLFKNIFLSNYSLFNQDKTTLKQTNDLELDNTKEGFEVNGIPQVSSWISSRSPKGIYHTCYYYCSNIYSLSILKSSRDKYLQRFGFDIPVKPTQIEIQRMGLNSKVKNWITNHYTHLTLSTSRFRNLKTSIYEILKANNKRMYYPWMLSTPLDFILTLEGQAFKSWIKLQETLSERCLDYHLYKVLETKMSSNFQNQVNAVSPISPLLKPDDEEIESLTLSSLLYWDNFYKALKTKPYLWLSALNSWKPDYYTLPSEKFIPWLYKFEDYLWNDTTHVPLQSIWIESPKGKFRMLCVPNFAYCWVCRLWNDALSLWVENKIPCNFHGFIYGRGCKSWWQHFLMDECDQLPYIYEFDMASY